MARKSDGRPDPGQTIGREYLDGQDFKAKELIVLRSGAQSTTAPPISAPTPKTSAIGVRPAVIRDEAALVPACEDAKGPRLMLTEVAAGAASFCADPCVCCCCCPPAPLPVAPPFSLNALDPPAAASEERYAVSVRGLMMVARPGVKAGGVTGAC